MSNVAASEASGSGTCVQVFEGWEVLAGDEPRVRDFDLAERAGLAEPRKIRRVIASNRQEIEAHGILDCRARRARQSTGNGAEREYDVEEYWLNEGQAIALVSLLRTPKAREVRVALVKLFVAWRRGELEATPPKSPALSPAERSRRYRARARRPVGAVDAERRAHDALREAVFSAQVAQLETSSAERGLVYAALARLVSDAARVLDIVDGERATWALEGAAKTLGIAIERAQDRASGVLPLALGTSS